MALSMTGARIDRNLANVERELSAAYGFVTELFRVQTAHPLISSALVHLLGAVLLPEGRLTRFQKEGLVVVVARARGNKHCPAVQTAEFPPEDTRFRALTGFALQLACCGLWFSTRDVEQLRGHGFDEQTILEAAVVTALGQTVCILIEALVPSDPRHDRPARLEIGRQPSSSDWQQPIGPYLQIETQVPPEFAPFSSLRNQLGFIPKLFRAQMARPDLVAAQIHFLEQIVHAEKPLSRIQKEQILLAVSAANLNTYGVALQRQILDGLGVPVEQSDEIVNDVRSATISAEDKALLQEVSKLSGNESGGKASFQPEALENQGLTKPQVVEAIAVAAFANFLNTLQFALGVTPDFPPARIFTPKDLYLETTEARPTLEETRVSDPDAEIVQNVKDGDLEVFEELVRRHSGRVFRTVAGILGNLDDARDATQNVFLKAFENIAQFEGRSKFSTWLISIAINTGTEMLRHRKHDEPLEGGMDDDDFRPRQVQQWADDPEQIFTAAQRNELVRDGILRLPEKYRVALILRDISQLSSEDAAAALEIGVPALKARVLRGRLMLRERLANHFAYARERDDA